ncbi:MAG: PaaI family thioesterase [Nevskiales bacterium]
MSGITKLAESSEDHAIATAWQSLLARIPYARHLGLEVNQGQNGIEIHLPYREALVGNSMLPALHGGVIGGLIEITARIAVQSHDRDGRYPHILTCNTDYLRSAGAQSTFASPKIIRHGRRSALVQVTCRQEDSSDWIACGRVQLLFPLSNS